MGECFSKLLFPCFKEEEQRSDIAIERRAENTTSTPLETNRTFIINPDHNDSLTSSLYHTALGSPADKSSSQEVTLTQEMFGTPSVPINSLDNNQCITLM